MNPIGIMQGRLSPPHSQRLQAFPWNSWEQEFAYAREQRLNYIEWLFEAEEYERNPIWTQEGVRRINELVQAQGVAVNSVCADFFLAHPFFRVPSDERAASIRVLKRLIRQAAHIGVKIILIPVLEVAEIHSEIDAALLVDAMRDCLPSAHECGIHLALETELPADQYKSLIMDIGDDHIGVYYDIGNAAAQGYDTAQDIRHLGPLLRGVHVKDRILRGSSVPLGEGSVDFAACFSALREIGYSDSLVLQTFFESDFLSYAKHHIKFVRSHMRVDNSSSC